ncbi:hypothetical protein [Oceanobacillus sp. FSL W7-1293]|uniref:hypothetical protein n=1 Tax=Oceanobacillus sp. FSL W7-1293 TaxID=2921699 RepID=UPI0030D085F5
MEMGFPKEILYNDYVIKRLSSIEIANKYNTSKKNILAALTRYGINRRTASETRMPEGYKPPSKEKINDLYWNQWLSYEEIGKALNVDPTNIPRWLKLYGLTTRTHAETRLGKHFKEPTKGELIELYVNQELPTTEIGKILGCGGGAVSRRLYDFGIEVKSNLFNGKSLLECDDGHMVKSYYEKSFDNLLSRNGIEHEYEPRLPFDKRYSSDFLIDDVYVEIWGVQNNKKYNERRVKKTKLYNKHGLKLLEIYPEDFKDINSKFQELKRLIS